MKNAGNSVFEKIKEIEHGIKHLVIKNPEYLTYKAAAKYLGKTYGAIRVMIFRGHLTPVKSGNFRYLRTADLDAFLQGKRNNEFKN